MTHLEKEVALSDSFYLKLYIVLYYKMIKYNLLLITKLPNRNIEKLEYYIDYSLYSTIELLHNHLLEVFGNKIGDSFNIFYFYNGKILTDKVIIDNLDKTIIAYLIPKPQTLNSPSLDMGNSNIIQNLFQMIMRAGDLSNNLFTTINNTLNIFENNNYESENDNYESNDNDELVINSIDIFNTYEQEYLSMISMGFNDEPRVSLSLHVTNGNLEHAINYYLTGSE